MNNNVDMFINIAMWIKIRYYWYIKYIGNTLKFGIHEGEHNIHKTKEQQMVSSRRKQRLETPAQH